MKKTLWQFIKYSVNKWADENLAEIAILAWFISAVVFGSAGIVIMIAWDPGIGFIISMIGPTIIFTPLIYLKIQECKAAYKKWRDTN
jgi:hypothetical protein